MNSSDVIRYGSAILVVVGVLLLVLALREVARQLAFRNQTLAQRERDWAMLMEHVPAGVCSLDVASHLRLCNTRYAALFGATPDQLLGSKVADYVGKQPLVGEQALDAFTRQWDKCLAGQAGGYRRLHQVPQTGETRVLDVELVPELDHGRVVGLFAMLIDVTEKVLAQEKIQELSDAREAMLKQSNDLLEAKVAQRTEHLQALNAELDLALQHLKETQQELVQAGKMAALGAMVAGVAHELNTPLGNARLVATSLAERAQHLQTVLDSGQISRKDITQRVRDFQEGAALIDGSLERAADLVQSFKQVAADQASSQRRSYLLDEVIREHHVLLSHRLRQADVRVQVRSPQHFEMYGYPGALGQVLTSLIENAMVHGYAGAPGRVIAVEARALGEGLVRITVSDQGCGIAAELLGRVFDPFFTSRMGQGGCGLGLSMVYGLVTRTLGGKISVESMLGAGTTFTVELPVNAPETTDRTEAGAAG